MHNIDKKVKLQYCGHCGRKMVIKPILTNLVKACPKWFSIFSLNSSGHDFEVVGKYVPEQKYNKETGERL